jgi:hypothetical protein
MCLQRDAEVVVLETRIANKSASTLVLGIAD